MRKIDKKGFTMVELLATIVIIGVLSVIGVVSVSKHITNTKKTSYKVLSQTIYEATKNCIAQGKCAKPTKISAKQYTTKNLIDMGYITNIKNPNSSKKNCDGVVTVTTNDTTNSQYENYDYSVQLTCEGVADNTIVWSNNMDKDIPLSDIKISNNNSSNKSDSTLKYNNSNIENIYKENSNCVSGNESNCEEYDKSNNYQIGSLVIYKVNDTKKLAFRVLHDDGEKLTLIQANNTVDSSWTDEDSVVKGPETLIKKLNDATNSWTNVPYQSYSMGTTSFLKSGYNVGMTGTACIANGKSNDYISCYSNSYKWDEVTTRARAITGQELAELGCKSKMNTCPSWLNGNYFWAMNVAVDSSNKVTEALLVNNRSVGYFNINIKFGARAVIVIDK